MIDLGDTQSIYVDVDGTLLIWPFPYPGRVPRPGEPDHGKPPRINTDLVQAIKAWKTPDRTLVIWSWGGEKACRRAAELCGLEADAYLIKPHTVIDDAPGNVTPGNGRVRAIKIKHA